ncbi:MAG: HAMP domain-containing histidine kinase [Rickettsiaceae bacterium]|nr:HAMP domain-containing histidine kinase [Rickettsiaceae bacterium]
MEKNSYDSTSSVDRNVAIQMITLGIIIIVVIITLISFIHIYSSKKEQILEDLHTESTQLETVITDHLNYSRHFINLIGDHIQRNYKDLNYINNTLKNHSKSQYFNLLFGWRKYSWIDSNFFETVTNREGIVPNPKKLDYIKDLITTTKLNDKNWKNSIIFYNKRNFAKDSSLKIIDNISDKVTKKYIGSVILSYDIDTMIKNLNARKKKQNTNFIILDQELQIVTQSKPIIQNLINENLEFEEHLNLTLQKLILEQNVTTNFSYLDMLNGLNYFVKPLTDLPFTVIINIDSELIKKEIITDLAKSFILVCIFASLSLGAIIFIYRRETFLRAKAERSSLVAESATKAKTNFLAFTAHEIRSPLGFILTGSEIMTKEFLGKLPTPYKKYAQGIYDNSKLILDFITDILDENQIIEGKFKIINALTNVQEVINEAIQVNLARFNTRRVEIITEIEDKLPLVICDRRRILQVLNNLISNSIKYSKDDTTITITVKIAHEEMVITVMDQGIGMKESDVPIALSAYGTLREQDYNSLGSYGLGLAIVKMLLEAHETELIINSVEGKGTTVKMIFPKYKLVYTKAAQEKESF